MAMNLANEFKTEVDERFEQKSYADIALGSAYEVGNNKSITIYDVPVAPLQDYKRPSALGAAVNGDRYGDAFELQASTYTLTMSQDKSFNTIIDRGDLIQSQMVMECNKFLSRELNQVVIPEYDAYVFQTLGAKATEFGNTITTKSTKSNVYEQFLQAQEHMGNYLVPNDGRVAICSYSFANLLKQDNSFVRYGDTSQEMLRNGEIGTVDGVRLITVPSNILPNGCSMIMTHPFAAIGPKQLYDYKIHDNPPTISGYKVEGRFIWDCFVLQNKANAIFYIGNSGVLRTLTVITSPSIVAGKSVVTVQPTILDSGHSWYYVTGASITGGVTAGEAKPAAFTNQLSASGASITPASGDTWIEVVEVDADNKACGYGLAKLNIG